MKRSSDSGRGNREEKNRELKRKVRAAYLMLIVAKGKVCQCVGNAEKVW